MVAIGWVCRCATSRCGLNLTFDFTVVNHVNKKSLSWFILGLTQS